MSHNTCIGLPPSGLIVYTPLDVKPIWRSLAQLWGSVKARNKLSYFLIQKLNSCMSNVFTYCKAFPWSHLCTCIARCHFDSWGCRFLRHHKENCPSHRHSVWNNYWYFSLASIDVIIILSENWIFSYFLTVRSNWNLEELVFVEGVEAKNPEVTLWARREQTEQTQSTYRIRIHCVILAYPFKWNEAISLKVFDFV